MHIWRDLSATDGLEYKKFEEFCTNVWKDKYNFVTIDLTRPANLGKYRKNLNLYWSPTFDQNQPMEAPHFHDIKDIEDEEDLLSKMIHVETQIRAQAEAKRLKDEGEDIANAKIFEPITKELKTIAEITSTLTPGHTGTPGHTETPVKVEPTPESYTTAPVPPADTPAPNVVQTSTLTPPPESKSNLDRKIKIIM